MLAGIILALLFSILWIGIQIIWMHIRPADNRFKAMLTGFLVSLPPLLVVLFSSYVRNFHANISGEPFWLVGFHALLMHILVFFLYVECFYHIERSITFRMLIEIAEHPEGIQANLLRKHYSLAEMISSRMEVLKIRKFVCEHAGRWRLLSKGRIFAQLMRFTLWLFNAKSQKDRDV